MWPINKLSPRTMKLFLRLNEIANSDMLNDLSRDPDSFLGNKGYELIVDGVFSVVEQQRRQGEVLRKN